jgi:peptide/nickel transport system substrate-binding protein
MKARLLRLRLRRGLRVGRRQVEDLSDRVEDHIEQDLLKRFGRLLPIRRFVIGWTGLLILLIAGVILQNLNLGSYYQTLQAVPGGIYTEGVKGRFTNASPLYATSDADTTVSRLIFAGLFTYDNHGRLTGDLASGYDVDSHGNTYTVRLKPNLTWQDGQPLTSADVLFTYQMIQNPDTRSPLLGAWQGIRVSAPDKRTIVFRLPGGLAAFPHSLTNGIVPRHLLEKIAPADLRSADFNTVRPVGAGPFAWQAIQVTGNGDPQTAQQQIGLTPFYHYQGGRPKLQKFIVKVFASESQLIEAFSNKQLTAAQGLTAMPKQLKRQRPVMEHSLPLRAATMAFFRTSGGVLSDGAVRQALVRAADVPGIIKQLGYPTRQVREPLLAGQLGYDQKLAQAGFDLKAAKTILAANGWTESAGGVLTKNNQPLGFKLTAANTPDYHLVAGQLQRQWRALGAKVTVQYLDANDYQNVLNSHDYDAILGSIAIGADPDVFVYWDSSQADIRSANRLNLSEYKNAEADAALEAGRTRNDPGLRVIKYRPFLEAWQKDNPALGLYQPRLLYLTNGPVGGLENRPLNTATDRFDNVHNWQIRQAKVTNR